MYGCWYNWSRGPSVSSNTLTVPQERADLAALRAIERDVLDPDVVETGLALALQELTVRKLPGTGFSTLEHHFDSEFQRGRGCRQRNKAGPRKQATLCLLLRTEIK